MAGLPDLYSLLEVQPQATADEIRTAYKRIAASVHPDVNKSPLAATMFRAVTEAYEILRDPERRAEYDRARDGPTPPEPPSAPPPSRTQPTATPPEPSNAGLGRKVFLTARALAIVWVLGVMFIGGSFHWNDGTIYDAIRASTRDRETRVPVFQFGWNSDNQTYRMPTEVADFFNTRASSVGGRKFREADGSHIAAIELVERATYRVGDLKRQSDELFWWLSLIALAIFPLAALELVWRIRAWWRSNPSAPRTKRYWVARGFCITWAILVPLVLGAMFIASPWRSWGPWDRDAARGYIWVTAPHVERLASSDDIDVLRQLGWQDAVFGSHGTQAFGEPEAASGYAWLEPATLADNIEVKASDVPSIERAGGRVITTEDIELIRTQTSSWANGVLGFILFLVILAMGPLACLLGLARWWRWMTERSRSATPATTMPSP